MCRKSFLGGECKFHHSDYESDDSAEGIKAVKEAEATAIELAVVLIHEEQAREPIKIDVWKY